MAQYPDYKLYIAKIEHEVIGSFALLIMDNLAHFGTPSAIIEDVVVSETLQNKGIGKLMMEFAMEKAKEKGCYKMVLSSNLIKLLKFWHYFPQISIDFDKFNHEFKINSIFFGIILLNLLFV